MFFREKLNVENREFLAAKQGGRIHLEFEFELRYSNSNHNFWVPSVLPSPHADALFRDCDQRMPIRQQSWIDAAG